jgi:hypothetical protein
VEPTPSLHLSRLILSRRVNRRKEVIPLWFKRERLFVGLAWELGLRDGRRDWELNFPGKGILGKGRERQGKGGRELLREA